MKKTIHSPKINHYPSPINHYSGYLLLTTLFFLAFLERTAFDLGPNIELVTTAMILSAYYLGSRYAMWLVLAIMVTTDLIIGNTNIFLFTWSGFLIPALFAGFAINKRNTQYAIRNTKKIFATSTFLIATGITANIFFFLWTNFGVWLLGSMYAKDLSGLFMSYINAIPFFKNQLLSTLVFIPLLYTAIETATYYSKKYKPNFTLLSLSKKQASR
jgi:hypothetical protein